jgi:hypothetical protein
MISRSWKHDSEALRVDAAKLHIADCGLRITGGVQAADRGASHRTGDPSAIRTRGGRCEAGRDGSSLGER